MARPECYPLLHPFTPIPRRDGFALPVIVSSEGIRLVDETGRTYLDGVSSLWNVNLGHNNKEIKNAIRAGLEATDYSTLFGLSHEPALTFAKLLVSELPAGMDRVFLTSGGSEAVETALKLSMLRARARNGDDTVPHVIHLSNSYHGVSLGALSAMGLTSDRKSFEPLMNHFHEVPGPYCYRCPLSMEYPSCQLACTNCIKAAIREIEALGESHRVAAVILEPVQGAGGIIVPPVGYLECVAAICKAADVPLVVDEVATGFLRTGAYFAFFNEGVCPDVLVFGKAATGGYLPLGGVVVTNELADEIAAYLGEESLPHGFTFGGCPLACAAGVAALEQYADPSVQGHARAMSRELSALCKRAASSPWIGSVRQRGLMVGFEVVKNRDTKEPFGSSEQIAKRIVSRARDLGLIIRPVANDTVPLLPPLTTQAEELDQMFNVLFHAIESVAASACE